jgi:hypothetical protein
MFTLGLTQHFHICNAHARAGVLVLEEYEHAKARGARIYAEYVGGAFTCDAHHMTEPQPEGKGVALCINRALASAGGAGGGLVATGAWQQIEA